MSRLVFRIGFGRTLGFSLVFCLVAAGCGKPPPPPKAPTPPRPAAPKSTAVRRGALSFDGIPPLPARLRRRAWAYFSGRNTFFVDWSDKGDAMLVRTRFGDTDQLHLLRRPMGARTQLTFFDAPVGRAAYVKGSFDNSLLLSMDRGSTENHQLYRLDLLEGKTVRLTDSDARHCRFVFSNKGQLAFNSNRRNHHDFDIYLAPAARKGEAKRVYRGKGYVVPLDFSPDEKKLLLLEYVSINESYLHLLDLERKAAKLLTPRGETKVAYGDARFGPRGKTLLLSSDRQGEFVHLFRYDLAKSTFTDLTPKLGFSVESLALSPDRRTLAYVVNEGGFSRLYVGRSRGGRARQVKLPDGVVDHLEFSSRSVLGFSLMRPTAPSDAYAYDPRRNKLTAWTASEVGGLNSDFFVAPTRIRYPTFDRVAGERREIPAFYFRPPGAGPHPVVLMIHGGPEAQYRPRFSPLTQYLLMEMGVAVIAPNVRGSRGYGKSYLLLDNGKKREDAVKDVGALLEWIKAQKELDAGRVMVHGRSYGGYMVLASLSRFGARLRAGVEWAGITDFVTFLKNTKGYRRDLRRAEYGDERDAEMNAFLRAISPLKHADTILSPLFMIQGANDPRMPRSEAEQIVKAVRTGGNKAWYLLGHNEGSGFRRQGNRRMARMLTLLFVEMFLKK